MSTTAPAPVSATAPVSLEATMAARRSPEQRRALTRMTAWQLITSLWAPLCVVGLAFIPYILLIEYVPPSAAWAQPAMKGLSLAMLVAFGGLWLWRTVSSREKQLRQLRSEARELVEENERLLRRVGAKVGPQVTERLAVQALRLEEAAVAGQPERLEKELKALEALTQEHLGPFRKASPWDFAVGFAKALGIALFIRIFLIEPYRIPSGSMLPTLEIGDQVFINKFIYGVRLPFTNWVPFTIVRPPARGDVIVFNNPVDTSKDFIKRVVGVPGDRVEIIDEVVFINGQPQTREAKDAALTVHNQDQNTSIWYDEVRTLYAENLDGRVHAVLQDPGHPHQRLVEGPYVVPEGHVFVMGDNRDNSLDSRYGLGFQGLGVRYVPFGNIKGKAMVVWMAFGHGGWLSNVFGGTGLRTDRLFEPVR